MIQVTYEVWNCRKKILGQEFKKNFKDYEDIFKYESEKKHPFLTLMVKEISVTYEAL